MSQAGFLLSSVVGLLLIGAIVVIVGRGGRSYVLPERFATPEGPSLAARAAGSPAVWTLAFVLTCLVFGGGAVLFVGGVSVPDGVKQAAGVALAAGMGVVLLFYLFYGTVVSARGRGLKNSQAVALGSWVLGMTFIALITVKLLGVF